MNVTKNMDPTDAFLVAACCVALMSLLILVTVKEPDMHRIHKPADYSIIDESMEGHVHRTEKIFVQKHRLDGANNLERAKILARHCLRACKDNKMLVVCFMGATIIKLQFLLTNTFLLLWITSFIQSGQVKDQNAAKDIISNLNVILVICMVLLFKPMGTFADKVPAYLAIPAAFLTRAIAAASFLLLTSPDSVAAYTVNIVIILATNLENITVDGYFMRHLPKEVRGTMNSGYNFFGAFGILVFSKVAGQLYDEVGP
jgi:hypothetical protein